MTEYKYKAQKIGGGRLSGKMNAADESELQRCLREEDALLISAKEVQTGRKTRQFKAKVLADFSRQLSTLVGAGVTLVRALSIISNGEAIRPRERETYEDMLRQIRQGISLSAAMESQNGAFPPLMIYMFRSAENSGNLEKVSMQMAVNYEKEHRLNGKISSSLLYPKILAVMIVAVILILSKFVMPQFQDLFDQMEELPLSTRILNAVSSFMQSYWIVALTAVLGIWVGVRALLKIESVRVQWDKMKLHIPFTGKLQKIICTSRFARTLSALYSAGIPIVASLQIARKTIGNSYIDRQFDEVILFVRAGNNLSDGLDRIDGFVRKLSDSIRVGEETGSLDSMLLSTAEAMEYDADIAINKLVSYVEPVMLIVMGIIVAFVMVAVFSALYGSYDAIAGME